MTHSLFCSKALAFKNLAKKRQGSNKSKIELFSFLFLRAYSLGVRAGSKCLLTLYSYWSARCPATDLGEECLSLVSCSSLGGFLWTASRHDTLWAGQQAFSPCIFLVLAMDLVCQAAWHVWLHRQAFWSGCILLPEWASTRLTCCLLKGNLKTGVPSNISSPSTPPRDS